MLRAAGLEEWGALTMIKTKSIYEPVRKDDGLRVLITRWYPRGVKKERYDVWVRELAPSAGLLKKYQSFEIGWADFSRSLLSEFRDNADSIRAIHTLQTRGNTENITLLCHERDGKPCHRHMVRDLIKEPALLERPFLANCTDD